MKAHFRTRNNRITFEIEGDTQKALFRGIAELQQVFEADDTCGVCNSADIRFCVRVIEDNEYYELRCQACDGQLSFGQHKKGGSLFAKRRDKDNNILGNRGWYKYHRKTNEEEGF